MPVATLIDLHFPKLIIYNIRVIISKDYQWVSGYQWLALCVDLIQAKSTNHSLIEKEANQVSFDRLGPRQHSVNILAFDNRHACECVSSSTMY